VASWLSSDQPPSRREEISVSSRNLVRPFFPIPTSTYSRRYMEELVRSFSTHLNQLQNPGAARATDMVLTALQTTDQGLETGALFQQGGFVKIALANTPHVGGLQGTTAVGSVTVVTT
jgi:hypothetical protein